MRTAPLKNRYAMAWIAAWAGCMFHWYVIMERGDCIMGTKGEQERCFQEYELALDAKRTQIEPNQNCIMGVVHG